MASCTFQIAAVFNFPFVIAEDQRVDLNSLYPNRGLRRERDPAALYFSAYFFCSPHICFPLFVDCSDLVARILSEYIPVCASCRCSRRRWQVMLVLRLLMYVLQHPAILLFSRRPTGRTIFTGSNPINDSNGTSRMNVRWSPMPYLKGITQALLMSRLLETHIPSIGFDPQNNFTPGLVPVCCTIASHKSSPFLSPRSFPIGPLMTCSL